MPKENTVETPTEVHPNPAPTSPFNYEPVSEEEYNRKLAMDRATDKVPNAPFRPIL